MSEAERYARGGKAGGYYQSSNTQIPLNNRPSGDLAQVAKDQLVTFQDAARTWPIYIDVNDLQACHRCELCLQNIWFGSDQESKAYHYTEEEINALIVAHIRQVHFTEGMIV